MKGFILSTDYEKLWDLVNKGYTVPAWIIYSTEYAEDIWDLVEVKHRKLSDCYGIGSRGICYESGENTFEAFKKDCISLELKYIPPLFNYSYR